MFFGLYIKRGPWTVWASVYSVQIYKPLSISVRQSKLTASGQCLLVRISRTAAAPRCGQHVVVYMSESCRYMLSHNVENSINNHNFIMNWNCSYLLFECRTTEYYMEYIDMQTHHLVNMRLTAPQFALTQINLQEGDEGQVFLPTGKSLLLCSSPWAGIELPWS